jgi:hypothetical protein
MNILIKGLLQGYYRNIKFWTSQMAGQPYSPEATGTTPSKYREQTVNRIEAIFPPDFPLIPALERVAGNKRLPG